MTPFIIVADSREPESAAFKAIVERYGFPVEDLPITCPPGMEYLIAMYQGPNEAVVRGASRAVAKEALHGAAVWCGLQPSEPAPESLTRRPTRPAA